MDVLRVTWYISTTTYITYGMAWHGMAWHPVMDPLHGVDQAWLGNGWKVGTPGRR